MMKKGIMTGCKIEQLDIVRHIVVLTVKCQKTESELEKIMVSVNDPDKL